MTIEDPPTPDASERAVTDEAGWNADAALATAAVCLGALKLIRTPNPELLRCAVELYPDIRAALHRGLDALLEQQDASADDANLLFWGVHIMAAARDETAFAKILALLALPSDVLDLVLGEAQTITTTALLASTFDGDIEALTGFAENLSIEGLLRWQAIDAVVFLSFDGRIPLAATEAWLHRLFASQAFPSGDEAWYGVANGVANLGLDSLAPAVRAAFAEELIDTGFADLAEWETLLAAAKEHPDDASGFARDGSFYITDIAETLAWVTDAEPDDDDEEFDALAPDLYPARSTRWAPSEPVRNPLRHVGRNDPCPCGSGKKYKKCCMPG